jgi:mono/diheme cytochrome c family protein
MNLQTRTLAIHVTPAHSENSINSGKVLFEQNCAKCHGLDGTKGKFGAKNLQKSTLSNEQYLRIIQNGKGIMPSWEKKLSAEQITAILSYIKTLKK